MSGSGFENDLLYANNADFSNSAQPAEVNGINADNQIWLGRSALIGTLSQIDVMTLTQGAGITLTRAGDGVPGTPGTLTIAATGPALTDLHVARFIVSQGPASDGANFTDIATAYAAAVAVGGNQTVFVQPGTYIEDIILSPGVNITAFVCDSSSTRASTSSMTGNVVIRGKLSASFTGRCALSNLWLETNGDYALEMTGANVTYVVVKDCTLIGVANSIIHSTNTGGGWFGFNNCYADLQVAGITHYILAPGAISCYYCKFFNSGGSATPSTNTTGGIENTFSTFEAPISTAGDINSFSNSYFYNVTVTGGAAVSVVFTDDSFSTKGGAGIPFTVTGATVANLTGCSFSTTGATAISGTGTLSYGNLIFTDTGNAITATTTTGKYSDLGKYLARKQPAFLAYNSANDANTTGDGTVYTVICDTEVFDQDANYNNATGVFTAPITGRYSFKTQIYFLNIGAAHTAGLMQIVTSNRTIDGSINNPTALKTVAAGETTYCCNILTDMDSGDTATIVLNIQNSTKTITVGGAGILLTYFSGNLSC